MKMMRPIKAWAIVSPKGAVAHWLGSPCVETNKRTAKRRLEWFSYRLARVEIREIKR